MRYSLILLLIAVMTHAGDAQDLQNYQPLHSLGEIPEEFRSVTANKVSNAQAEVNKSKRVYSEKARINDFLLRSNYAIDALLTSGKVLFNDSVTNYINRVADKLLADDPELNDALRFYTIKTADVNAFATKQGIIFVTLGMMAQIENEAQLAFVLAHEIAHYEKDHSLASVLESAKVYNETKNDRYNGYSERIRLLSSFSRDMEFEADEIGFNRMKKAGYNFEAASSMMDVLQLSFLPFSEEEVSFSFLETEHMKFPVALMLDSVTPIPYDTDMKDDSRSSHPNINKRRETLDALIVAEPNSSGAMFLFPQSHFLAVQSLARFELVHMDLVEREYVNALYNCLVLAPKYPDNRFLEVSMAKALYGIAKYKNERKLSKTGLGSDDAYGNIQRLYYLFEEMSAKQINLVAIMYVEKIQQKHQDPFLASLLDDLVKAMVSDNSTDWSELQAGLVKCEKAIETKKQLEEKAKEDARLAAEKAEMEKAGVKIEPTVVETVEQTTLSKYDRLREEKKKALADESAKSMNEDDGEDEKGEKTGSETWSDIFHFMSLKGYGSELAMSQRFSRMDSLVKAEVAEDELWEERMKKKKGFYKHKGYALGIDSVVFVDPFFFKLSERNGMNYKESEKALIEFKHQIEVCSEAASIEEEVLFPKTMSSDDLAFYNDMATMNDWMGEQLEHQDNGVEMIPLETEYTRDIASRYGTPYFAYTGIISYLSRRDMSRWWPTVYCTFPVMIVMACIPVKQTNFYYLMYNIESGHVVWELEKDIRKKPKKGFVNSLMYDVLYQVQNDRSKE